MRCPTSRAVDHGDSTTFTIVPAANYDIDAVSGCGGSLFGTTYTTGTITGACTVTASFKIKTYTVTASDIDDDSTPSPLSGTESATMPAVRCSSKLSSGCLWRSS